MEWKGVYPAMVTPLTPDENIDKAGLRKVVNFCLDGGVHGIVVLGSTGEFPGMTEQMREDAVSTTLDEVKGRVPVLVGCGDTSTKKTVLQIKAACQTKADGVLVAMPYYFPIDQNAVLRHFMAVADASTKPVMVYNFPAMTKVPIAPDTLAKLAQHPNIFGVKDSSGDYSNMQRFLAVTPEGFTVFPGNPALGLGGYVLGAQGGIFAGASLVPKLCVDVYKAFVAGDMKTAVALQKKASLIPLMAQFGINPVVIKYVLSVMGICGPTATAPMALNPGQEEKIFAWMKSMGYEVGGKAAKA